MQKRCKSQEGFKTGEYTIRKKHTRRQGETIKKAKENPTNLFGSFVGFVVVVLMVGFAFIAGVSLNNHTTFNRKFFSKGHTLENVKTPYKSMAVIESNSGRLLSGYHETDRLPMASTTKIMTAILTIEKMGDLTQEFIVPEQAVGIEGSSMYLKSGEKLALQDYLYGLMLPSGNDAAVALAYIVSGSEEAFAESMNEYARALGLENTNFVTASGLHDDNHYTTSLDLAKLTAYAMKNDKFREIVGTQKITIKGSSPDKPRHLKNKQKLITDEELIKNGITVTGVKSGFTPEAGRCLVTSAECNGMEVIAVVLNAPEMFLSTANILKEVFSDYEMVELIKPKQHITKLSVSGSETKEINVYTAEGFSYPLTNEEKVMAKLKYIYADGLSAPIQKDQPVGELTIELYGQALFKTPIRAIEEAKEDDLSSIINKLVQNF